MFRAINGTKMITSDQIRAARALVRWSAEDLARESGVGLSTIRRIEAAQSVPSASGKNLALLQSTLERAGVQFIERNGGGPGVRLRT
jgi:transcriptional regulator with XRE-family HTH domain